ncbi:hypothetical protein BdWA1_000573 [Babesia duncani]|uniref:Uncharacterized protein n=1 Tax=Babesia duncani TaxID=323732 RepID=A0AAD9PN20_9APIC|nr:hypothetical protein BdWA1_000573 [Babesia duncani]
MAVLRTGFTLFCLVKSAMAYVNVIHSSTPHLSPSFLTSEGDYERSHGALNAVFMEFNDFNSQVLDQIGDRIVSMLEKNGYDFENNPQQITELVSFLESGMGHSSFVKKLKGFMENAKNKAVGFYHKHKDAVKNEFKKVLVNFLKNYVSHEFQHAIPVLEKINERTMVKMPLNVRLILAPVMYNIWKMIFEKNHIPLPPNFSIEELICKGMDYKTCESVIEGIKETHDIKESQASDEDYDMGDLETDVESDNIFSGLTPKKSFSNAASKKQSHKAEEVLDKLAEESI